MESPDPHGHSPWDWDHLSAAGRREALADLGVWLFQAARDHAVDDKIPSCWFHHPGLVSHLVALHSWQAELSMSGAIPSEASSWHEAFYRIVDYVWPRFNVAHPCDAAADERSLNRRAKRLKAHQGTLDAFVSIPADDPSPPLQ
jgi:hypothetical protein